VVPVLGGAWFTEWLVQSTAGTAGSGFGGALATGALAWATYAIIDRFQR
jgi:hypothetical protein